MKQCYFCQHEVERIDFKNTEVLQKFTDKTHTIKSRKRTGLCASHQRELAKAIKRARQMALIPYQENVRA